MFSRFQCLLPTPPGIDLEFIRRLKLVSWDLDGTLYRMAPVKARIALALAGSWLGGDGRQTWASFRSFLRHRRRVDDARAVPARIAADSSCDTFVRNVFAPAVAAVGLRRGVGDAIDALDRRGIVQVVASDYGAVEKLAALRLGPRFKASYAGDHLGFVKPHPGMLKRIADDFGIASGDMLHIGDRMSTDGAAAAAFGCRFLLVGRGTSTLQEFVAALTASPLSA